MSKGFQPDGNDLGAGVTMSPDGAGNVVLSPRGSWTLNTAGGLGGKLDALAPAAGAAIRLDLSDVTALDTVGAYLLARLADRLGQRGHAVEIGGLRSEHAPLFDAVRAVDRRQPARRERRRPILGILEDTGRATAAVGKGTLELLSFLGLLTIAFLRILVHPDRLRFKATLFHIQQTGVNALPILGLLSFLIGVVMAFQGAEQLQRFGAELYVVNLLGISIFREIGILMTSIIVAGRSGSAFTAQIGTMKVNEEVDAIQTLGLDPVELLVVPRALALMISLPLIGFYADIMGLLGGAVMCWVQLDITPAQFVRQLNFALSLNHIVAGMAKAPVFALTIALVGCHEGMKVARSAESVGKQTTRAVVQSIFLVIVIDAAFSILFSILRV